MSRHTTRKGINNLERQQAADRFMNKHVNGTNLVNKYTKQYVKSLSIRDCNKLIDYMQDKLCNLDYTESPELYNLIAENVNLLEARAIHGEF